MICAPRALLCAAACAVALAPGLNFTRISAGTNRPVLPDCADGWPVPATRNRTITAVKALFRRTRLSFDVGWTCVFRREETVQVQLEDRPTGGDQPPPILAFA